MMRLFVLTIFLFSTCPFLSAQEEIISESYLTGCWELLNNEVSKDTKTYVPCKSKIKRNAITFNSYGEYHIRSKPYNGRCGANRGDSRGRFVFNSSNQTLKFIDSRKQQTITWKISKFNDSGFTLSSIM